LQELAHGSEPLVNRQIKDLTNKRARRIRAATEKRVDKVRQLVRLRGIGPNSAWLYVMEFFAWRRIRNRKQLAALAGLTPTPHQSSDRLRAYSVKIDWLYQGRHGLKFVGAIPTLHEAARKGVGGAKKTRLRKR
jgi:Transposase IS116/IS110/IS902 family